MKIKILLLLCYCFLSTSLQAQLRKIKLDSIPISVIKNAKILAFDAFKFQKDKDLSKFLWQHANLHLNKVYNLKMNNEFSELVYTTLGKVTKVTLKEVLVDKNSNYIFRFKGYYDKTDENSEIRLKTNSLFKFSEFIWLNWYYEKYYENPEKVQLKKLNIDTLSKKNIEQVNDLAQRNWRCKSEDYLKLTLENATPTMINFYSDEKMTDYCNWSYEHYGYMVSMTLTEVLGDGYRTIYRYKAEYELIENFMEVTVVTNAEDKLHMMFLIPEWKDSFTDYRKK